MTHETSGEYSDEYLEALAAICELFGVPFAVSGTGDPADVVIWLSANVMLKSQSRTPTEPHSSQIAVSSADHAQTELTARSGEKSAATNPTGDA